MRFRAPTLDPGVALAAAMLLALPGSALAEDANPPAGRRCNSARRRRSHSARHPRSGATGCRKRERACQRDQYLLHRRRLDQGGARRLRRLYRLAARPTRSTLVTAHSVRAMGFSAIGDFDAAIAEMDARRRDRPGASQLLFHARRGLRGQEGLRQGHRRSRQGDQPRRHATAISSCCAASSIATRATSTGRLSS